jgi:hypothetical protein
MTNDLKWMISSDQQIPFHDPRAIQIWWDVMDWLKPSVVDYLGDTSDQFCFARFQEGTTTEFLAGLPKDTKGVDFLGHVVAEEKATADFYAYTREKRPRAQIFSALGNHDIRAENYVDKKIPEIYNDITPENLWGLDNLGIDYIHYNDVPRHRFGGLFAHHGIAASAESGASVKSDMSNLGVSLIRGHSHRLGTYYRTYELKNEILRGYEIGHMCKVDSPGFKYSQIHNWQQGFAVGLISGDQVHIQLVEILPDYTAWVAGRKFSA